MEAIAGLFGLIGGILSIIMVVFFFILVGRVGSLLDYSKAILSVLKEIRDKSKV